MTDHAIVLSLVFAAVAVCAAVFLPIFFVKKKNTDESAESYDNPIRRFIDPDDLQRMRYSLCMLVSGGLVAVVILLDFYWGLIFVAVMGYVAYELPKMIIDRKVKKRNIEFETGMFDFTILISNTLRAGVALPSAIEMAIQSIGGPIREEFSIVLREHRLGVDLADSIERMSKRITSENLQLFAATVCITMKTGGSIADVLDHVVTTIRQKNSFEDKLKAMIAQAQFEAFAVSLSPVAAFVLLYLLNDKLMMPMLTDPIGWGAIGLVIILETVGYFVLKKVVQIKY